MTKQSEKIPFFSPFNLLIFLKAVVVSLVTGVIMLPIYGIAIFLVSKNVIVIARLIQVLGVPLYANVWGYFATKWWGWF